MTPCPLVDALFRPLLRVAMARPARPYAPFCDTAAWHRF